MRTPVCELLGIEQPIVQAPMSALVELAAAVSNAGGLGMLALTWSSPAGDPVRQTAALTDRPFGGNLIISTDQHRRLDEALEAGLKIVSLFWGDPAGYVEKIHDAGALLLQTVSSAEEARQAVAAGTDVIVAQGWEGGGHVKSQIATLPLVPAVVDAVAPVPVIAAGGIGDARGVAAVFALGAQAAWLGTRFLLSKEMPTHEEYRAPGHGRGGDRRPVVRRPLRRRMAECAPPGTPELDRRHVGGRGPAASREPPRGGRCARPLRLGRRDRPVRARGRPWSAPPARSKPSPCGRDRALGSSGRPSPVPISWPSSSSAL